MPRRALIGPWGHNDPVHGAPGPAVGILGELVRWWDRWLKGIENGIEDEPMVVAWMQDSVRAGGQPRAAAGALGGRGAVAVAAHRAGARCGWATAVLGDDAAAGDGLARGRQRPDASGLDGGAWCADAKSADLPLDQRSEDARSLCFTSAPLAEPVEILGFPEARLVLTRRPAGGAGLGPAVRGARRRRRRCWSPAASSTCATAGRTPSPEPVVAGRGDGGHGRDGLDRAPVRGRQPHPALGVAVLLAAGLALAARR